MTVERTLDFRGHSTWCRVEGEIDGGSTPVIVLHGGPGSTHDYVDDFRDLARDGRAVVHYDQIGNGRSSHLPGRPPGFWTVNLFLAELDNLIGQLGLRQRYALVGHSWGGMLAAEHAVTRPAGLKALVLVSAPAFMERWIAASQRLRQTLPADTRATLLRHEAAGTFDHPDYKAAVKAYEREHFCRLDPWPDDLLRTVEAKAANPSVFAAMIGPDDLHVTGRLHDWSILDRLDRIDVPTQLISGRYDEAAPDCLHPFAQGIRDVRWMLLGGSSHTAHLEERDVCMATAGTFLAERDAPVRRPRRKAPELDGTGSAQN